MGDRECPNCGDQTLVESSLMIWKCLKCFKTFDEDWLDECEEDSYEVINQA